MSPGFHFLLRLRISVLTATLLATMTMTAAHAAAVDPRLQGRWIQGGLLTGSVEPGSKVWFGGRALTLTPDGHFVIGLAYDAAPAAVLEVQAPGGARRRHEYPVQTRQYEVQKIGGLPKAMVEPPADVLARIRDDQEQVTRARAHDTPRADFATLDRWPLSAQVTGVFGSGRILNGVPRQPHFGIDLAAAQGAPVRAPAGGVVRLAATDLYYTGGTVILDHGHGVSTTYLHLSRLDVAVGDEVSDGQVIGRVGATGRATGPHLCWRANWFDVRLDPSLLAGGEPVRKGDHVK